MPRSTSGSQDSRGCRFARFAQALGCSSRPEQVGTTTAFELKSPSIKLGDPESAELVALAAKVDANFAAITDAIENWAVVAGDGGAAGKLLLSDASEAFVSVAAMNVEAS